MPTPHTPTQKSKIGFSMFSFQEIGSGLVSFEMIFEALQSEQGIQPSNLGTDSHTFEFNICFKIKQHISATLS